MLAFQNATLVMADYMIPKGTLLTKDDKIIYAGTQIDTPEGYQEINGTGLYAGPGLIDIHLHSGNGVHLHNACPEASKFHLDRGSTSIFPTLYFTMDQKTLIEKIKYVRECVQSGCCSNVRGLYVEGPYMNPDFGASRNSCSWAKAVSREDYLPVIQEASDFVKVWGCAPERENIEWFVRDAKEVNPNIIFSVAHSTATPQQIQKLMPYGLKLGTHHTNATGTIVNYSECRGCCVDEAVNYFDDIYAELICDEKGIHVDPFMLRLVRRIKGREKVILITDCSHNDGPPLPGCEHVTDICFDHYNEISGTKMSLNQACRNMMMHTGASMCDVFYYASHNPAHLLGMTDRGELRPGAIADVILVDHEMDVKTVVLGGRVVHSNAL